MQLDIHEITRIQWHFMIIQSNSKHSMRIQDFTKFQWKCIANGLLSYPALSHVYVFNIINTYILSNTCIHHIKSSALTILLRNWLSKKCAATCAGNKLYNILLFDSCKTAISRFSWDACNCQRKSSRAVHSTCRPCVRIAIINITMRANEIVCSGIVDLKMIQQINLQKSTQSHR